MSLSIKNPKADWLARELSELTGESLTEAVTIAVEERLARLRRERQRLVRSLMKIARESALHLDADFKSQDIDSMLYDERGLPK